MHRTSSKFIAAVLLSATLGGTAFAQGTMEQQNACRGDVFRLCGSYIPDVGQIVACLRGNESRLSDACHDVMFEAPPTASEQYSAAPRPRVGWNR
ncbi:MAG TPA: cysteine rich repeat-containing protein [Rhizomicrobium sp.]